MHHEDLLFKEISTLEHKLRNGLNPLPKVVEFYPTNVCNLSCSFCFGAKNAKSIDLIDDTLTLREYQGVFAQLKDLKITHVSFSGGGEPFSHKDFYEVLSHAIESGFNTRVVTNGTLIKESQISTLLNLNEIRFSINAFHADTYSRIMSTNPVNYRRAISNLRLLINSKRENGYGPDVGATFVIQTANYEEVIPFIEYMIDDLMVDDVIIKLDVNDPKSYSSENLDRLSRRINSMASTRSLDQRIEFRRSGEIYPHNLPCFIPHFKIAVNPIGQVYSCCLAAQPSELAGHILGDLRLNTLQEIWMLSKNTRELLKKGLVSCRKCNYTDYLLNQLLAEQLQ